MRTLAADFHEKILRCVSVNVKQIVQTGNIALIHTEWKVSGLQPMTVYVIELARRQADGTWLG